MFDSFFFLPFVVGYFSFLRLQWYSSGSGNRTKNLRAENSLSLIVLLKALKVPFTQHTINEISWVEKRREHTEASVVTQRTGSGTILMSKRYEFAYLGRT